MDWIFQTEWQAMNKEKNIKALFSHSLIYTLGFIPVVLIYNLSFWVLGLILVSHLIIDKQAPKTWIMEKIKGLDQKKTPKSLWLWLSIVIDQTLHFIILALIASSI